jgi:hypothetical protein
MTFVPSKYRVNRRRFYDGVEMSLSVVLNQLLNRTLTNHGKVYRVTLEHGLQVALLYRLGFVIIQISRKKPVKPSIQELITCLKALHVVEAPDHTPVSLEDDENKYLQVSFVPSERIL